MISLSAPSYDPNGTLRIKARFKNPYQGQRRGSVTATLDGGSSVYDGGYSVTDQSFTTTLKRPSKADLTTLQYLIAYYGQVVLCCEAGAFTAIPSFALSNENLTLNCRITGRKDT